MSEPVEYPPIEPATFDLIVVGTGLAESIIAAAASAVGKSVLHIDPNSFYGSHFSSLSLSELISFLHSHSITSPPPPSDSSPITASCSSSDYTAVDLTTRPLYSDVEVSPVPPDLELHSRKFSLDVSGPRVLFCADPAIDLLMKSGVSQYLEFKSIDASFIHVGNEAGGGVGDHLLSVPDSRAAIFKDRSLGLKEKNKLMRFFKDVQVHLETEVGAGRGSLGGEERMGLISEEELESPFVEFLNRKQLPPKIKLIILYSIVMADFDQDNVDASIDLLKTRDGINRLSLYHSSLGRFSNASGAMLYPMYGLGELPQAFCRRAAVKGCLYVLRMPTVAVLVDRGTAAYKGIKLASGQDLFSHHLVLDPILVPKTVALPSEDLSAECKPVITKQKIARGICITKVPLQSDVSNLLIVYPPRSLFPEQVVSVRVLQVGSNLSICPQDMFVFYLSARCVDSIQGKAFLNAAINILFKSESSETSFCVNPDDSSPAPVKDMEEMKPTLLWSALYIQEFVEGSFQSISSAPSPDGYLSYNNLMDATRKMFQELFPNEEFFPDSLPSEDCNEDHGADPES